jgi:hypothetical protein
VARRRLFSLQERLEASDWGRAAISAFIGITLATLLVIQLQGSHLRAQALELANPYSAALGLDQDWAVFAPEPRRIVIDMQARISYADGSTRVWHVPVSNDFVGSYWDYRWLKYMETAIKDVNQRLWVPFAIWVARRERSSSPTVKVELIRRWSDLTPPGRRGPSRSPWHQYTFFTFRAAQLRALGLA